MIRLNKISNSESITVTLNEGGIMVTPNYLFIFQNTATRESFAFIFPNASDVSENKARYNRFVFDTSVVFASVPVGDYTYTVYEQASLVSLDPYGRRELENGQMKMIGLQEEIISHEGLQNVKEYVRDSN